MMRKIKLLCSVVLSAIIPMAYASTQAERIAELERIALYEESDDLDEGENEVIPTPDDAKKKFNLTDAQLLEDIKVLEKKYSISETNEEKRLCRNMAVLWMGGYGTTNEFQYLRSIMYDKYDYAQEYAIKTLIERTKLSNLLLPIATEVVTNKTVFSEELRRMTYCQLHCMCVKEYSSYVNNTNLHKRLSVFFLERAALEPDMMLYVDSVACDLNPSYRHSQQRRDNLARLRKPGLTGLPAQIYDAAQRDALSKEGE